MSIGIVSAAYIAAAVLFILALGGLSGQESAKRAVWYGNAGMALAVAATVFSPDVANLGIIAAMVAVGAIIGWVVATRVQMTEMPQLVAALHSFVGLAAVLIGFNADIELNRVLAMDETARQGLIGFGVKINFAHLHVKGQVDQHWPRPSRTHQMEGVLECAGNLGGFAHRHRPLAHGLGNRFNIDGLKIFLVKPGARCLARNAQDWNGICRRRIKPGNHVGSCRPRCAKANADIAGLGAGITLSHVGSSFHMAR